MTGDQIACFYDGRQHLTFHDRTFGSPGSIGLWSKADAQRQFDDLKLIAM